MHFKLKKYQVVFVLKSKMKEGFFMEKIRELLGKVIQNEQLINVILAIFVFIVGWVACQAISKIMAGLLHKIKLDERLNKKAEGTPVKLEGVISKFVYYVLLIYVLMISLDLLGAKGVLDPLKVAMEKLFAVIPDAIAAVFIGFLGYILAKVVSSIVLAASSGLDPLAGKAGLGKSLSISKILEKLVFIVLFVPTAIAALDKLNITAISDPAKGMLDSLFKAVPEILFAAISLIVAYIVGKFVTGFLADLLKDLGSDEIPEKIGANDLFKKTTFSKFISSVCFFFIMLSATLFVVDVLNVDVVTDVLKQLLQFSGNIVIGLIILGIGSFIANIASDKLAKSSGSKILPLIVKVAILGLIITMGLETMHVGEDIIKLAFMFTLGTISITIILAFGLGGREAAGKLMGHWLDKLQKK